MKRLCNPRYPSAEICYEIICTYKYQTDSALSVKYGLSKHYIIKICDEFGYMNLGMIKIKLACIWDEYEFIREANLRRKFLGIKS